MSRRLSLLAVALLLLAGAVWLAPLSHAQTVMPTPYQTVFDNSGKIVNNACVWTYVAGTTTPGTTYSDVGLSVPNGNPIRADSAGRFVAYLTVGASFKFTYESSCTPPAHGTVYRTVDNVVANPSNASSVTTLGLAGATLTAGTCAYLSDGSGSKTPGDWYPCDSGNTYSSTQPVVGIAVGTITSGTSGSIQLAGQVTGLSALTVGGSYYVSTAGALTSTAMPRFLGLADSTTSLQLFGNPPPIYSGWTVVTTTSTGTQNDFAPGLHGNTVLRANNASLLTITGFAGGYDGEQLLIESVGAGEVDFSHQDTGSTTAADRLVNFATIGKTPLAAGSGVARYVYDGTSSRWRLVEHTQGAAIEYSATSTIVGWTGALSPKMIRYFLQGRQLTIMWALSGTSNSTSTTFTIPFTGTTVAAGGFTVPAGQTFDNGAYTASPGQVSVVSGSSTVLLQATSAGASWTASGTKQTFGVMSIEVQ